jgi:hypothetical protein
MRRRGPTIARWKALGARRLTLEHLEDRRMLTTTTPIFSDDFKGAFPGDWIVGNYTGTASWGDNDFKAYSDSWSAFCADNGTNYRNVYDSGLFT